MLVAFPVEYQEEKPGKGTKVAFEFLKEGAASDKYDYVTVADYRTSDFSSEFDAIIKALKIDSKIKCTMVVETHNVSYGDPFAEYDPKANYDDNKHIRMRLEKVDSDNLVDDFILLTDSVCKFWRGTYWKDGDAKKSPMHFGKETNDLQLLKGIDIARNQLP